MSTRVYVGGISHRTREKDLEYFFRKYGKLRDISIKNGFAFIDFDDYRDADDAVYDLHKTELLGDMVSVELARGTPHGRDKERFTASRRGRSRSRSRSRSKGRRSRSRSSSRSRSRSRGRRGGDSRRPIWLEKYGPPTRTEYRVIVENLSSRVSWQDLKDFMRTAGIGTVTYADAHKQRRNEGVVEFSCYEDVENVIDKLDGAELNGRKIKIINDSKKRSRRSRSRRSRSRGSKKSRTRSRSRSRSSRRKTRSPSKSRSHSGGKRGKSGSRRRSRSRSAKSDKSD